MKWSDSTTGRDTVSFDQNLFGGQPNAPVHLGASPLMSCYCYNRNNTHDPKGPAPIPDNRVELSRTQPQSYDYPVVHLEHLNMYDPTTQS